MRSYRRFGHRLLTPLSSGTNVKTSEDSSAKSNRALIIRRILAFALRPDYLGRRV